MTLRLCASVAALMIPLVARADVIVPSTPSAALGGPALIGAAHRDFRALPLLPPLPPLPPLFAPGSEELRRDIRNAQSDPAPSAEDFATVLLLSLVFPRIDGDGAPTRPDATAIGPTGSLGPIHTVATRDEGAIISLPGSPSSGHHDARFGEHALAGARAVSSVSFINLSSSH